ncbi:MAG: hypothetical protein HY823_01685 [Acidobacteria bacterium]|nr:hypothetical protein [Acidobacteriota bacterium]
MRRANKQRHPHSRSQSGGLTIMVALLLLVLLTVAAVGMSRNSFREVVITGTSRQGTMVRNVADSGIEWSLVWIGGDPTSATPTALALQNLRRTLLQDDTLAGKPYDPITAGLYAGPWSTPQPDLTIALPAPSPGMPATTQWTSVGLTRMGKLPIQNISQGVVQGSFTPAQGAVSRQAPDLWALRSDAQVQVGSGALAPTFVHSKEAFISTAVGVR